jgi:hypothetical protein
MQPGTCLRFDPRRESSITCRAKELEMWATLREFHEGDTSAAKTAVNMVPEH